MDDTPDLAVLALGSDDDTASAVRGSFTPRLGSPQLAFRAPERLAPRQGPHYDKDDNTELDEVPLGDAGIKTKGGGGSSTPGSSTMSGRKGGSGVGDKSKGRSKSKSKGFWPSFSKKGKEAGASPAADGGGGEGGGDSSSFTVRWSAEDDAGGGKGSRGGTHGAPDTGPVSAGAVTGTGTGTGAGPKYPFPVYFPSSFMLNELTWPVMLWIDAAYHWCNAAWARREGGAFLVAGVFLAALNESLANGAPRYNCVVLLILAAASSFDRFPLTMVVGASLVLDMVTMAHESTTTASACITSLVMLAKVYAVYHFLTKDRATQLTGDPIGRVAHSVPHEKDAPVARARKFLSRRTRVFCLTFKLPRRLMREIRNRVLAIQLVQLVTAVFMFALFLLSITRLGYAMSPANPHSSYGISPAVFLFVKSLSSALVFSFLFADTDALLALHHYGCLGLCTSVAKDYIHAKREEYGGWPVAYAYNAARFRLVFWAKMLDVCWGVVGWVTYVFALAEADEGMSSSAKTFFLASLVAMLMADVWVPSLFFCVRWLVSKHEEVEAMGIDADSDDSEIEELGLRKQELTPMAKERVKEARRQRMASLRSPSRNLVGSDESGSGSGSGSGSDDYSDDERDASASFVSSRSARSRNSKVSRSGRRDGSGHKKRFYNSDGSSEGSDDSDLADITLDLAGGGKVGGLSRLAQDQWGSPYGRVGGDKGHTAAPGPGPGPASLLDSPHSVHSAMSPPQILSPHGGQAFSGALVHGVMSPPSPHGMPSPAPVSMPTTATMDSNDYEASYGYASPRGVVSSPASVPSSAAAGSPMHPPQHHQHQHQHQQSPAASSALYQYNEHSSSSAAQQMPLTLNHSASIDPRSFATSWQSLPTVGHFECSVRPFTGFSYRGLTAHLKSAGFFVVAAGKCGSHNSPDAGRKLYVFGEAFLGHLHEPVTYMCEMKVVPGDDGDQDGGRWSLVAESKCDPQEHVGFFVAQLSLASVFELLQ